MTRITSWFAVAAGLVLGLSMGAVSADAADRSSCDARIFQGETEACYRTSVDLLPFLLFRKEGAQDLAQGAASETFRLDDRLRCGCQLRRPSEVVCAGNDTVIFARVNGNGSKLVGEAFDSPFQDSFLGRRVDVSECPRPTPNE